MYFSRVRVKPDIRELSHLHHILRGDGYSVHRLLWDLFPRDQTRTFLFREEIAGEQIPHYRGAKGEPIFYLVSQNEPKNGHPLFIVESKPYKPRIIVGDQLSFKLRANPTVARKENGRKNSVRHDVVMDAQYHYLRELAHAAGIRNMGKKSDLKKLIIESWLESKNAGIRVKLEQMMGVNERYRELLDQTLPPAKLFELVLKAASDWKLEEWLSNKGKNSGFVIAIDERQKRLKFQAEGYHWHAIPQKGRSAGFSSIDFEGEIKVTDSTQFVSALFTGIGSAKAFGCGLMLVKRI
ncbi:MAG TPA: type I-E CRISPR-associated protein Cas6/Cse3/CasE [Desulfobacteraceae bacterium]|nr:type I-E CRISPR-associated protein Cas6/Cse3/CasE [Desulfobacteraceae bacterium]HPJ67864.1 type I-E CRISPR-associated protein Cas6/Cse3/CasE [Desulfobacteraceae bacterium]HPQ28247.1 type I-E CRISPR-associated protein Cas6/Cse3/CasE [Desulfobacteraceae bacterium]